MPRLIMLSNVRTLTKPRTQCSRQSPLLGIPIGEMIEILAQYRVESNLEAEDYRRGLEHLR